MALATLIGYFAKKDEAVQALRGLTSRDFRSAALIHKGMNGEVRIEDPLLRRRLLTIMLAAVLTGAAAGMIARLLHWTQSLPAWTLAASLPVTLAAAATGALAAILWLRRVRPGVDSGVLGEHASWLVCGESVLILQAPVEALQRPVTLLRESGDIPPALFVMHPRRERRSETRVPEVKLSRHRSPSMFGAMPGNSSWTRGRSAARNC